MNLQITEAHLVRARAVKNLWRTLNDDYEFGVDFAACVLANAEREGYRNTKYDYYIVESIFHTYERYLQTTDFWNGLMQLELKSLEFNVEIFKDAARLAHLENGNVYFTDFLLGFDCDYATKILSKYKQLIRSSSDNYSN